jgi:DNA-binding transcriptional LysR family regulator
VGFELRALRYFVQVAELGSLSRAARALSVAQPALSQQISGLETHLGVQLFSRGPHGVELTTAGLQLLDGAKDVLGRMRTLEEGLSSRLGTLRGLVTVGLPAPAANMLAEPLVVGLRERHPELCLRIEEARTVTLLDGLLAGHLDLAVTASLGESGRIQEQALAAETLHLVGSREAALDGSVTFDDVLSRSLVLSSKSAGHRSVLYRHAQARERQLDVVLESTSLSTSKRLIARGGLFGIMTWSAVMESVVAGELSAAQIIDPVMTRPLFLCQLRDRRHSRATQIVAAEIVAIVDELRADRTIR